MHKENSLSSMQRAGDKTVLGTREQQDRITGVLLDYVLTTVYNCGLAAEATGCGACMKRVTVKHFVSAMEQ